MSYVAPVEGGTLVIAGCEEGHYVVRYETVADEPFAPEILVLGDINHNSVNDVVFATQRCDEDDEECVYRTQVITWEAEMRRFVSLLSQTITSDELPEVIDTDNDQVSEILIRLESNGTDSTGPLRTGINIYDWDGSVYVLSIVQLDPPRFRVQIVHEADRYFAARQWDDAINLYQLAFTAKTSDSGSTTRANGWTATSSTGCWWRMRLPE